MNKYIAIAALAGLVTISAQAANEYYITGATAFRGSVFTGLQDPTYPGGAFTLAPGSVGATSGTSVRTWVRPATAPYSDIVYESYSGSTDGLNVTANSLNATTAFKDTAGVALNHVPDLSFADCKQSSSPFKTPALTAVVTPGVAVVTFSFVGANLGTAGGTNITDVSAQQMRSLLNAGQAPKSLFTGNPADTANVFAMGRIGDSGTRIIAQADTGYGVALAVQLNKLSKDVPIAPNNNSVDPNGPYTSLANYTLAPVGPYDPGYVGGGALATAMQTVTDPAIAHISVLDAKGKGLTFLSYGGIPFSRQNVINGAYSYWSNEQLYRRSGSTGNLPAVQAFGVQLVTAIRAQITATTPDEAINFSEMGTVKRTGDGTIITF